MKKSHRYQVVDVRGFENDLFKVAKRYPTVVDVVESLFDELEHGQIQGDRVSGIGLQGGRVYKTRVANPDARKGKSGGFRVIWYLITANNNIYPLTIYSKSDQTDISNVEIRRLMRDRVNINL